MSKNRDVIDEIAYTNNKARNDLSISSLGGKMAAEFLDTVNKHPRVDKNELLKKMRREINPKLLPRYQ